MAQVISVNKKEPIKPNLSNKNKQENSRPPLFRKVNYILMGIGVLLLGIGYILLSGGGSEDPNQFSEAIFDTRRLVVAPIMIVAGLAVEIVAIMWHPKRSE